MSSVNEVIELLPIVGPSCDEHRAKLIVGDQDWELQGSEQSADGSTDLYILMGDSTVTKSVRPVGPVDHPEVRRSTRDLFPLLVHRRGDPNEGELTLLITREMLPDVAQSIQYVVDQFGREQAPKD